MAVTNELARLYREYYANRLSHADYRYQRGMLLDSLLAEDSAAEDDITISRVEAAAIETAPEPEPEPEPRKESRGMRWPAFAAGIVVLFGGTIYVVTTQLGDPGVSVPSPAESEQGPAVMAPEGEPLGAPEIYGDPDVGQPLVEAFMTADDWGIESLQAFVESWGSLPAQDRIVAKGAMWFVPLADRLEYEIGEAEEFTDQPDSDVYLQQLYLTAVGLGLTELAPENWKPGLAQVSIPRDQPLPAEEPAVEATVAEEVAAEEAVEEIAEEPSVDEEVVVAVPDDAADEADESTAAVEAPRDDPPVPVENENACNESQLQTRRRGCFDVLASGGEAPPMRVIAAGSVAGVEVDAPFAISAFEVSRADFVEFCERTGAECPDDPWPGESMPVVNVSWHDAVAYCDWLSAETGFRYRLPTDAEWEYAARAGSTSNYPFGDEITAGQARYSSITAYDKPLPTDDRTTQRNDYGLWHVVGNVREWVAGSSDADDAGVRGGSYADSDEELQLSSRQPMPANGRDAMTGFRIVREL